MGRVLDGLGRPSTAVRCRTGLAALVGRPGLPRAVPSCPGRRAAPARRPGHRRAVHRRPRAAARALRRRGGGQVHPARSDGAADAGPTSTVVALVGERGRELREFVEDALGAEGLRRSVVVCATSRRSRRWCGCGRASWPPPSPSGSASRAATCSSSLDSVTRLARAQREVGLAAGEPPARQGYPPSVFSMLPRLLERTGNSRARLLHRALHLPGGGRRPGGAHRRRGARHPRRPRGARPAHRRAWPLAGGGRAGLALPGHAAGDLRGAPAGSRHGSGRCSPPTSSGATSSSSVPTRAARTR